MKDKLFKYSKDRSFTVNLILSIFSFIGILIIPSLIYIGLSYFVKNALVANIIADVIFILILYLIYYKDLNEEFKIYNGKFKENFKYSFKIYLMGFMGMVFFNLIISMFLKNISSNESQVREMLYASPVFTMLTISIIAPVTEELVFRKSLQPVIKNKWIYVLVCGILFGFAHILTNFVNGIFVITDLFYVFPYAALGCSFALMDYDTKTTFSSITLHFLHNTLTGLLLLMLYFGGNL